MQKQGFHHRALSPSIVIRPFASTWNSWSRQETLRPKKLATNTANDKASRTGSSQSPAVVKASAPAIINAEAHLSRQESTRRIAEVKPNRLAAAARAASATGWVKTEPAKPAGVIARTVRAQRSSCCHRLVKDSSDTRASTT